MHAFVSGRPSLDLVGTLKWRNDKREELLLSTADASDWFATSQLHLTVRLTTEELEKVRDVREALYRTITAVLAGRRPIRADLAVLNALAAGGGPAVRMAADGSVRTSADVTEALALIVRDAFDVLANDADRIGGCASSQCTRLFVDTSPSGNRKWCGMAECGNRAKVAAHRARRSNGG